MSEVFRVYTSPDIKGIELGGSLKNVIALAAGIARRPRIRRQYQGRSDHKGDRRDCPAGS